jgi:dihydropteroate synthase
LAGCDVVRVHNLRAMAQVVRVAERLLLGRTDF